MHLGLIKKKMCECMNYIKSEKYELQAFPHANKFRSDLLCDFWKPLIISYISTYGPHVINKDKEAKE